jgi:uncharacterized GH25 family protein
MIRAWSASAALAAACLLASSAWAHFVWVETEPAGEQLLIRSGFGEPGGPGAWDGPLAEKIKNTKYWTRSASGVKPVELPLDAQHEEYRAAVSGPRPSAVLGQCDYGVIQRGDKPAFWLRYSAKNLVGSPSVWQDDKPSSEVRAEVCAKLTKGEVLLTVYHLGKPAPKATIKATLPDTDTVELVTDDQGQARWKLAGPGRYGLYVSHTIEQSGEKAGKAYASQKDYATLTFTLQAADL